MKSDLDKMLSLDKSDLFDLIGNWVKTIEPNFSSELIGNEVKIKTLKYNINYFASYGEGRHGFQINKNGQNYEASRQFNLPIESNQIFFDDFYEFFTDFHNHIIDNLEKLSEPSSISAYKIKKL